MKKWNFRRWMGALSLVLILSLSSGCSAGFWFSGQGVSDPDLVVYNDSTAVLGSISVSGERERQSVTLAEGHPLERGESFGFEVDAPGPVVVEVWDLEGNRAGRCSLRMGEERVYVTLGRDGTMRAGTQWPLEK